MRVFVHSENNAQSWHRSWLPVKNCAQSLALEGIDVVTGRSIPEDCDVYVFHRKPTPDVVPWLSHLHNSGKKIIWQLDDDLWHIPTWNPAHQSHTDTSICDWLKEIASEVWVSTEQLRNVVGRGVVLPNLIDQDYWPCEERVDNEPLRILWAGSAYHEPDLELIAEVFERLLDKYNVMCLFFGSYPESMSEWVRIPGSNTATLVPHARFGGRLGYVPPVTIEKFPETMMALNPDICLAIVTDEVFSLSKSNLKWLEASMTGAASVVSDLPPYSDVPALAGDTYADCCWLIEHSEFREQLGQTARQMVLSEWTWSGPRRELWLEAFRKAVS